jgi:hypothetical protein
MQFLLMITTKQERHPIGLLRPPPRAVRAGMRSLRKGIDPADLPDLAHYRGHGIDRINGW